MHHSPKRGCPFWASASSPSLKGLALLALLLTCRSSAVADTQTLSTPHSVVRFAVDTSLATMTGRFTRISGKVTIDASRISKLIFDIRLSEVVIDPTQGFEYLSPESLFRALPNPMIHFTSDSIASLGAAKYRADGTLTQGTKRWRVSLPFTAKQVAGQGTHVSFRLTGRLAELETPLPLTLNPQQDRGSIEGRLLFVAARK